jgi:hypothetical protein
MRRIARYQSGEIRSRLVETVEIARRILHLTGKRGFGPHVRRGLRKGAAVNGRDNEA